MTTTVKPSYAASSALTITLASLASSASGVAGRSSAAISNATNLYSDALVGGKITVGTSPTSGTSILIYAWAPLDDTPTYPDTISGSDAAITLTTAGIRDAGLVLAAAINVDSSTSNRAYPIAPFSVAALFGGRLPKTWGIWVTQSTGVALNSTSGNHAIWMQPVNDTLV